MCKTTSDDKDLSPSREQDLFIRNIIEIETEIMATEQILFIAKRRLKELKQARKDTHSLMAQKLD